MSDSDTSRPGTIVIEAIPHSQQRYETVGDWIEREGNGLSITVSDTGDWRYNALVGLHELVEALLCKGAGITQAEVDRFDMQHPDDDPGASHFAPYHRQHMLADAIERLVANELGVDWAEYERQLGKL